MGRWSEALPIVLVFIAASKTSDAFIQQLPARPVLRFTKRSFVHSAIKKDKTSDSDSETTRLNKESNDDFIIKNLESDLDIDAKLDEIAGTDIDLQVNVDAIDHTNTEDILNANDNDHDQQTTKTFSEGVLNEDNEVKEPLSPLTSSDINTVVLEDTDIEEDSDIVNIEELIPPFNLDEDAGAILEAGIKEKSHEEPDIQEGFSLYPPEENVKTVMDVGVKGGIEIPDIETFSPSPPLHKDVDTRLEADAEEEPVDAFKENNIEDDEETIDLGLEVHPPMPPSDESIIQAQGNDVEESNTLLEEQTSLLTTESSTTMVESDVEEEPVDTFMDNNIEDVEETIDLDLDLEAHPPMPPSDESIIQAHENDVEESNTLLEEQISLLMAESAATTVGAVTGKFYVESLQRIKDCKSSTEKSLARSVYERDKAAEKIAIINAKAAKQIEEVETTLSSKLDDAHVAFNSQKADILKTLAADIEKEVSRVETMTGLVQAIDEVIDSKMNDIVENLKIIEDIKGVRSKISQGKVADQLDDVLEKKNILLSLENKLMEELNHFKGEAESISKEARRRKRKIEKLVETLELPNIATVGQVSYDFSQIKEIELLMQEAAKSANKSNKYLSEIKSRFDEKLLERMECAGEAIPDSLKAKDKNMIHRKSVGSKPKSGNTMVQQESNPSSGIDQLKDKNEQEIASELAKSLGKFALSGAKAGIFGVKALIETLKHDEVSAATREVITKFGDEKDGNSSNIQDSLKSTSDTLGAVGKAGSATLKNVKSAPSASQATDALKETSNDFLSAFNAARALGMKSAKKLNEQLSTTEEKE